MTQRRLLQLLVGFAGVCAAAVAPATPLALTYSTAPAQDGFYEYRFLLTLDNHDSSWISGMNSNWIVFGDGYPASTLDDFIGDPASLAGSPFTAFSTSGGGNNGPTLLDYTPTVETGGWIPPSVGSSLAWSGRSRHFVGPGRLLFSNAQGSPDSPAVFELATLSPVAEPATVALWGAGLLLLPVLARSRRARCPGSLRPA